MGFRIVCPCSNDCYFFIADPSKVQVLRSHMGWDHRPREVYDAGYEFGVISSKWSDEVRWSVIDKIIKKLVYDAELELKKDINENMDKNQD